MYIEFHDSDIHNVLEGTHGATAGGQGTIAHAYQAEMLVQEAASESWVHRIFCLSGSTVLAVCCKEGGMHYVGTHEWPGEWQLPYLYAEERDVASTTLQELDGRAPKDWAAEALAHAACAIVVNPNGIHRVHTAWERIEGEITLVARGPGVEIN